MIDTTFLRRITAPQLLAQQKAFASVCYCLTPDCTESDYSWCHTISEASQLDIISETNNGKKEVAWIPLLEADRWKQVSWWNNISKSRALVFRGYCAKCDSQIFKSIDGELVQSEKTFALLAYRAASYAKWRGDVDSKAHDLLIKNYLSSCEDSASTELLSSADESKLKLASDKVKMRASLAAQYHSRLERIVSSECYDILNTVSIEFNERVPFRFTATGSFTTDVRMNSVEILKSDCISAPMYSMSILDFGEKSTLVISSPKEVPTNYLEVFLNDLLGMSLSGHLTDVLLRFMVNNNQGLVLRPSFIDSIGHEAISYLFGSVSGKYYFGLEESVSRICYPPHLDYWSLKEK